MSAASSTAGSSASTSPPGRTIASTRCPTATNSGCSSSPRWSTSRTCSCSTNRSPGSTPSPSPTCPRCSPRSPRPEATVLFSSHQLDLVEHLCEDVVIIDHGHIVLAGDLDELRAAVPQRFVDVRYRGAAPDWTALPGAELVDSSDGHARLRLPRHLDIAPSLRSSNATPRSTASATSRRRCPSCSVRRSRRERRPPRLARRET